MSYSNFTEFNEDFDELIVQETQVSFDKLQMLLEYIKSLETRIRWLEAKTRVLKDIDPEED